MIEKAKVDVEQRAVVGVLRRPGAASGSRGRAAAGGVRCKGPRVGIPAGMAPAGIGRGEAERIGQGASGDPLVVSGTALRAVIEAAGAVGDPAEVLSVVARHLEPAAEALPAGTMLLWVRVADREEERKAAHVLSSQGARSIRRHQQIAPTAGEDPLSGTEPDPFLPDATV